MRLCERCQQIPEEYTANLVEVELLKPIGDFLEENNIRHGMYTQQKIICTHCGAVYDLDIYTEFIKWDFSLKRIS